MKTVLRATKAYLSTGDATEFSARYFSRSKLWLLIGGDVPSDGGGKVSKLSGCPVIGHKGGDTDKVLQL